MGSTDMLIQFAPFVFMAVIFYFLFLRPQQQRAKEQRDMVQAARRGDVVVTTGGLIGKVTKSTDENEVEVEIAPNVRVRLVRSGIADVRTKGEPVKDAPAAKDARPRNRSRPRKTPKTPPIPEPSPGATRPGRAESLISHASSSHLESRLDTGAHRLSRRC